MLKIINDIASIARSVTVFFEKYQSKYRYEKYKNMSESDT